MTTDPLTLTGRDLDAAVAECCGWTGVGTDGVSTYGVPPEKHHERAGAGGGFYHVPRYSSDWAAAGELLTDFPAEFHASLENPNGRKGDWAVCLWHISSNNHFGIITGDTGPEAVARAYLVAKGEVG